MNNQERFRQFEDLKAQLLNCRECREQMNDEWPYFGNPEARIFQISQAPSRRVMETGMPFNDARNGIRLQKINSMIPSCFYIASIARCYREKRRSGDLRPPEKCAELYLKRELEWVQPRLYILIGAMLLIGCSQE